MTVTISNNEAEHAGGEYVLCLQPKPPYFFQLGYKPLVNRSLIDTIHVNVFDNSIKYFAGDNLFGGSIDYCYMIDNPKHKAKHSTEMFKKIFNIPNNTVNRYSITSSPLTVCLCHKDRMLCDEKLPHILTQRYVFCRFLTGIMICLSKRYSSIARSDAVKVLATIIFLSYMHKMLKLLSVHCMWPNCTEKMTNMNCDGLVMEA